MADDAVVAPLGMRAFGDWSDQETRDHIATILSDHIGQASTADGTEGFPDALAASFPQTQGKLQIRKPAPGAGISETAMRNKAAPPAIAPSPLLLTRLSGDKVTLEELYSSDEAAGKVTILNFGSYTSPTYRHNLAALEAAAARFPSVVLYHVYILEAHAKDGWEIQENIAEGICVQQPKSLEERLSVAESLMLSGASDRQRILVDELDNSVELAFEARPAKLVVVRHGINPYIAFKSGIGPYQYSIPQLEAWLTDEVY